MSKKLQLVLFCLLSWGALSTAAQSSESPYSVISSENVSQLEVILAIESAGGAVQEVAFDAESKLIVIASREGLLLWDLERQATSWRLPLSLGTQVNFSPDGEWLVVAAYPSLYLWDDVNEGDSWQELKNGNGQWVGGVGDVRFSSDGSEIIAVLIQSRGIYRWETDTKELLFEEYTAFVDESTAVNTSMLSADGQIGSLISHPERLEIIDTTQGDLISNPPLINSFEDDLGLTLLTFSNDNQQLLLNVQSPSNSLNSSLVFLDVGGEIDRQVEFDYETIWVAGTYSPDGEILALANEVDDSVHFFDATNMDEIGSVATEADSTTNLAFNPDGTLLASGGTDGTVRLWGVPEG